MTLKPRERILLLAAVLGIAAAAMVISFLSGRDDQARADTQVVTAASYIENGTILTAAKLQIRSFPKNLVPPDAALNKDLVVGKVARANIKAGQPISMNSLAAKDRLSYVVPAHMRAVTVGLDPVIGVGGFLKPGDCVDVVATFEVNSTSFARTVLQNVSLLAIGSNAVEQGSSLAADKTSASVQPTATLAVSPNDAEKLILADAKGKLRLTLRSADDRAVAPTKPVSAQSVMGVSEASQLRPTQPKTEPMITPMPRYTPPLVTGAMVKPAPVPFQLSTLPRQTPAAESTGKTIVIVRGTTTEETVVPK